MCLSIQGRDSFLLSLKPAILNRLHRGFLPPISGLTGCPAWQWEVWNPEQIVVSPSLTIRKSKFHQHISQSLHALIMMFRSKLKYFSIIHQIFQKIMWQYPLQHINIKVKYNLKTVWVLGTQSCLTLWDPMDWSLPGSSVHGILQARILAWVAIPFSRGSSWPKDRTWELLHGRQILYPLSL